MNSIVRFLNSHASARQFTEREITADDEALIVETAQRSPTSSNVQAYSIVSVRNQTNKDELARLCGNQAHVARSALFLVFCADLYRLSHLNSDRGYVFNGEYTEQFVIATVDATLAASRALMAAQAMGYGGVMVGGIRNNPAEVSELLALPELVYPVMGMSLGEPIKPPRIKPRLPRAGLHFEERYDAEAIRPAIKAYDATMADLGYLRKNQVEPEKYPEFDGRYSWAEHTARRNASQAPTVRRPHLLAYLRERGFLKR